MTRCFLLLALLLSFAGCGVREQAQNIAQGETSLANAPSSTEPAADEPASQEKLDARAVLLAATVKAKDEDKRVLVHLGAPW